MASLVQRIAHRGGSRLAPENTLAAFRNALTLPVDAIELDVQMSCDGYAIVLHDNTVERLTDGTGNVLDLDFAYLRSLNAAAHFAGGWPLPEQIPTLREVLDLAKGRMEVYIEIKTSKRDRVYGRYPRIAETMVKEVREAGMVDQVVVISFDWPILPRVRELEPVLRTGIIVSQEEWSPGTEGGFEGLLEQAKGLGCEWIDIDHKLVSTGMAEAAHKRGLKLGLWTVNELDELRRFTAAGVDALTTDRPDLFTRL